MKVINNFKVLGIVSILILSLGFIAGCSSKNKVSNTIQQSEETKGYENIDGKQTEKLLNSDKDVLIIDVRSEYEYEKGHLLNAINLPYDDDFKSELNEIIDYKDKTVLVYCRSGNRSEKAAVKLVDNGFKNVKNVTDGVDEYDYKLVKVDSITGREAEKIINDEFLDIVHENMRPMNELMTYYRCAIMEIETKFNVLNEEFSLQYDRNPIEHIKTRLKSPESIAKKIKKKEIEFSIEAVQEHIKDIAGVRVICSFPEDIYMLAECLLNQDDIKLIEKKDYIKNPKKSGYRSLHLIIEVPIFLQSGKKSISVEVQLRTIAMDFWASLEHKLRYKKNIDTDETEIIERELLVCSEISADLDKRMEEIRNRIENRL